MDKLNKMSAILKTGKNHKSIKSLTHSYTILSIKLPNAPEMSKTKNHFSKSERFFFPKKIQKKHHPMTKIDNQITNSFANGKDRAIHRFKMGLKRE